MFAAMAAASSIASAQGGAAVSVSEARKFTMDIPAQPLANALQAFSAVTGIETLYDSAVARERKSAPVVGTITAFEALRLLLVGTSLSARAIAQDAVTIELPQASADKVVAAPPERSPHRLYFGVIQQSLERALCENEQLRPGRYRAVLKFTIAANGQIRQLSLIGTTGDEERDRMIARTLEGVPLRMPPPADLQQPIMIVVLPQSNGAAPNCHSIH